MKATVSIDKHIVTRRLGERMKHVAFPPMARLLNGICLHV